MGEWKNKKEEDEKQSEKITLVAFKIKCWRIFFSREIVATKIAAPKINWKELEILEELVYSCVN